MIDTNPYEYVNPAQVLPAESSARKVWGRQILSRLKVILQMNRGAQHCRTDWNGF